MKKKKSNKPKKLPDINYLRQHFRYNPLTGELFDINAAIDAKPKGYKDKKGYWHIRINKQTYKLHRIVFYMFHGRDPGKKFIDHIDGDKSNNRILNLRAVTHRENLKNTASARSKGKIPELEPQAWKVLVMPV